jgi:low affinity Fe/Cu permease
MSHRAEGGDEKVDVLWAPTRLREREHRQNEERRADVKNQVAPTIQDPKVRARPCGRNCRNGLRPRKSGDVLHVEKRANYSLEAVKINGRRTLSRLGRRANVVAAAMKRGTMPLNNSKKPRERDFFCRAQDSFRHFARSSSAVLGSPWAFISAIFIIVVWGVTGPAFHFSDTWQLIINTGTTIVTFLMVFLIQNTQNRDAKAVHLKLDELIRAVQGARNQLVDLEKLSDDELKKLEEQFTRVRSKAAQREPAMDPTEEI